MRRFEVLLSIITAIIFLIPAIAMADDAASGKRIVPELTAYHINPYPPTIDGNLDDAVWKSEGIELADKFIQREPDEGLAATESTKVAVAYDDEALYVAFWCYDSEPEKIDRQLVRRDRSSQSDRVTVRLDPFHDHQTGHAFEVSAAGVQRDCRYYNENHSDMSWDAVWESGVALQPWGWTAEIKIPYHCIRFSEKEEHIWGADFIRYINRKNEVVGWAYTPDSEGGFVSNFGHLNGLAGIESSRHLELLPYAVSSFETEPTRAGNPDGRDYIGNTGFDLKYALSSNLILNATINPDFGQVELDQPVLNLSAYETQFSERRPFFLEGSDLFSTDFDLFYSRRVGARPGGVYDSEHAYTIDQPNATTILGAAKITGKLGNRTSIAILSAQTQEEWTEYAAETNLVTDSTWIDETLVVDTLSLDTVSREQIVEPTANYTVVRLKQDIFEKSSIGGMLTVTSQDSYHPATTGGVDWRLFTSDGGWLLRGHAIFSRVDNEKTGYGINAAIHKERGKHIRGALGITFKSPDLRINRLGYSSRVDSRHTWAWVQYRTSDDWWIVRNSFNNFNFYTSWNYDGVQYQLGGNYNGYIEFVNNWSLGGGVSVQGEKYCDLETRGNGLWEWPTRPTFSWWFNLHTDQRKKVSFSFNPGGGGDRGGHWSASYFGITYRPKGNMEFEIGANYKRNVDVTRWVDYDSFNDEDSSVFADLNRDEIFLHASAGLVINRNLTFQLSAQGLASGLDYENYRYYQGGNQYSGQLTGFDKDRNYTALNSTAIVRWEYLPGSTLYVVWTRAMSDNDSSLRDLDLNRDLKRMFSGGANNVFLVKTSYWLNI